MIVRDRGIVVGASMLMRSADRQAAMAVRPSFPTTLTSTAVMCYDNAGQWRVPNRYAHEEG